MASSILVALALGSGYLAYDVAIGRGWTPPGGDMRPALGAAYVAGVLVAGAAVTWLIVPLPARSGERRRRTAWSAALGFLAAAPVAYLVLVVLMEIVRPMLG